MDRARPWLIAAALALASAALNGLLAGGSVQGDGLAVLALLAFALPGIAGLVTDVRPAAMCTAAAYAALGVVLGIAEPSSACFFDCAEEPETFLTTAMFVWFYGAVVTFVAVLGGATRGRYRKASILLGVVALAFLGLVAAWFGERSGELFGLLTAGVLIGASVLFLIELWRVGDEHRPG